MRPIGTPLAVGDALVTCLTLFGPYWTNYTMGGLVLADGVTSGAGTQVITLNFITTSGQTNDIRTFINYQTEQVTAGGAQTSTPQSRIFVRLALVAANTWRQDLSLDGVSWLKSATYARTITPTYVGLHSSSWSTATKSMVRYEFFRRMSGVT
jgi:hypothetical protein